MRPEWTEKNIFFRHTHTYTQAQKEATQDDRTAIPPITTSTLSCPALYLILSLSLSLLNQLSHTCAFLLDV